MNAIARRFAWLSCALALVACSGGASDGNDLDDTHVLPDQAADADLGLDLPEVQIPDLVGDPGTPDVADSDAPPPCDACDVAADEVGACDPPYAAWLCPCSSPDDCMSGYCVPGADGDVCSKPCSGSCDEAGWECKRVESTCPDCEYVCVYRFATLCQPCGVDGECQVGVATVDARCVAYDGPAGVAGHFCGGPCDEGLGCPEGFTCTDVPLATGGTLPQ